MSNRVSALRRIKQAWRRRELAHHGIAETARLPVQLLGKEGGAWAACLENIARNSVVYSFGAGTDISFDLDVHGRTGADVHIFDPTPRSIEWVRGQQLPPGVFFHDYGVAAADGSITFYPPRRATSSHYSPVRRYRQGAEDDVVVGEVYCLRSIMARLGHSVIDLLKIDIEGGEYDVIGNMLEENIPVSQLLVEFHHSYDTIPLSRTVDMLHALFDAGFECFNISARTYEFSLVRNVETTRSGGSPA